MGQALPDLPALRLSHLLCHLCAHGPVCPGQRGGGRVDETSGGEQQGTVTEEADLQLSFLYFNNIFFMMVISIFS